jgi:predicted amidohydrolase YtcJ
MRTCAHIVVVNSCALKLAGIDRNTLSPEGGTIGHFENGDPNGILFEAAVKLITPFILEIKEEEYKKMILDAQEKCLEMGITSITDPEIYLPQLKAYEQLEKEGLLKIRINIFPVHLPEITPVKPKILDGKCNRKLQIDTVKFFADGGLSGQTASLFRPYLGTESYGILRMDNDYFFKRARIAQTKGWKIATHAIGDAAIEQVISVYKALKKEENSHLCHRIEHLGLPQEKNLKDMQELGIIAVSQPAFVRELGPNFRKYLDEEYQQGIYPYQQILDEKVTLAFSSDAPVVKDFRPLTAIKDALMRKDVQGNIHNPKERISMKNAFLAYTVGGAKADGQEEIKGKIAVGFLADFIVLDKNPFSTLLEDWESIQILKVFIGGIMVFSGKPIR